MKTNRTLSVCPVFDKEMNMINENDIWVTLLKEYLVDIRKIKQTGRRVSLQWKRDDTF